MSTLQDSDLFIVDRNGTNHQLPKSQMSTLQDTDLFIVERAGVNYKVEAKDVEPGPSGYFDTPVEVLTPLNGAGLNDGESYNPTSTALVSSNTEVVSLNFSTTIYPGTGTTNAVNTGVDNTGKSLVWIKAVNGKESHALFDTERGPTEYLRTDSTSGQSEQINGLTAFNADGFTVVDSGVTNNQSLNYVAWNFKAAPGFMDIQTWEGTGATGTDLQPHNHNLQTTPAFIITKNASSGNQWACWHKDLNSGVDSFEYRISLNDTDYERGGDGTVLWDATDTTFSTIPGIVGDELDNTFVAYLFASDDTNIKCGTYRGNGSASTEAQIECGFRPGWIMIKNISDPDDWVIYDNPRGSYAGGIQAAGPPNLGAELHANAADFQAQNATLIKTNDTGFVIPTTASWLNAAGKDYIYVAIRDGSADVPPLNLTFTDDTELENIIGPVRMVDENGDVKTPVTSAITSVDDVGGWNAVAAESSDWNSVAYGDDKFVAVAYDGANRVMHSVDGINWTAASAAEVSPWYSVTYGNGKFVAVAEGGTNRVMYSDDGINWTAASATENNSWRSVTYGDDKFVAVASDETGGTNQVMYSADGISWTAASAAEVSGWFSVTYGGDKFVAVAQSGTNCVMYSADGIRWTSAAEAEANQWRSVTYGDGKFVAVAYGGTNRVMHSPDGINWTSASATEANPWYSVTYGDGKFVAVAYSGTNRVMYSADGISWIPVTAEASTWRSVTYGADKFVAVAAGGTNRVMWSTTGTGNFTELTLTTNQDLKYLKAGDVVTAPGSTTQTAAFATKLYTGNATSGSDGSEQVITTGIDNTQKSMIWFKNRDASANHLLFDSERTPPDYRWLSSDDTAAEKDIAAVLKDKTTTGFTVVTATSGSRTSGTNPVGEKMVAWNFRAAPGFFDIVTWTSVGEPKAIPHSLGVEPAFVITKKTNGAQNWYCYHKSLGFNKGLQLNQAEGELDTSYVSAADSSTFTPASGSLDDDFVAYLFADTPGKIKCGSGKPFEDVVTTFKPQWILLKEYDNNGNWFVFDTKRPDTNNEQMALYADLDTEEESRSFVWKPDGFRINTVGNNFIYVAIAEDATAGQLGISGTLLTDADPSAKTMQVDSLFSTGQILTGPALDTVSNNVVGQSGDTLSVTDTTGTWLPGLFAEGATITASAPSPESIVFTSMNDGTTPVTGLDVSLGRRVWTLESSDSKSGPWTVVGTYPDNAANASQDGATPWGNPPLEANTFYQVKVKYESANANAVESLYNTFKTGDN